MSLMRQPMSLIRSSSDEPCTSLTADSHRLLPMLTNMLVMFVPSDWNMLVMPENSPPLSDLKLIEPSTGPHRSSGRHAPAPSQPSAARTNPFI